MSRSLVLLEDHPEAVPKLLEAGILTVHDLARRAARPGGRKQIATATGLPENEIYVLAKQADLLRVDGLDAAMANLLIRVGIRTAADLARCNPQKVRKKLADLDSASLSAPVPETSVLYSWKGIASELKPVLQPDKEDPPPAWAGAIPRDSREEMFVEMVDMVTSLGRGIALAQQEMDEQAIRTQKLINSDQRLRNMGLTASWFTIPDATLTIKLNYSLVREEGTEHDQPRGTLRFKVAPLNARTQNYFKLTEGMQSELNIRFASLPPPEYVTRPVIVPSLVGMTLDEAKTILADADLRAGTITTVSGQPAGEMTSEVADQLPASGSNARFQDRIQLFVRRSSKQPA